MDRKRSRLDAVGFDVFFFIFISGTTTTSMAMRPTGRRNQFATAIFHSSHIFKIIVVARTVRPNRTCKRRGTTNEMTKHVDAICWLHKWIHFNTWINIIHFKWHHFCEGFSPPCHRLVSRHCLLFHSLAQLRILLKRNQIDKRKENPCCDNSSSSSAQCVLGSGLLPWFSHFPFLYDFSIYSIPSMLFRSSMEKICKQPDYIRVYCIGFNIWPRRTERSITAWNIIFTSLWREWE